MDDNKIHESTGTTLLTARSSGNRSRTVILIGHVELKMYQNNNNNNNIQQN